MKKPPVIHPFLFAIFPCLSLFAHNINLISFFQILVPTLLALGFAAVLLFLSHLVWKDNQKAGIIVSGFLIMFFSFGHFLTAITWVGITPSVIFGNIYLLLAIYIMPLAYYVYAFSRTHIQLRNLTTILNIVAISLVIIPIPTISARSLKGSAWQNISTEITKISPRQLKSTDTLPDIYYIILDRYADSITLKEVYNYDNSEFINYLKGRGFYVASQSKANYLKTAHSLASSLNMEYINHLSDRMGVESSDWTPFFLMIRDNKVSLLLKSAGYKFIHFGSSWDPTRTNRNADMNFYLSSLPRAFYKLYEMTMLFPVGVKLSLFDFRLLKWKRILYQFDKLDEIPNMKDPTFVFAHFLIPHDPYVFDQNGDFQPIEWDFSKRRVREEYVNQLIFANKKLKALIERLLSGSEVPPIIILQSDEGPWPRRYRHNPCNFDWRRATKEELRQKLGILNAYYLPNADKSHLYKSITPVNTFRLIFNLYFKTNLELLPDESYAFVDQNHPYKFFNVTDRVRRD